MKINDTVRVSATAAETVLARGKVGTLTGFLTADFTPCGPDDTPVYGQVVFSKPEAAIVGVPGVICNMHNLTIVKKTDVTDLYCLSGHLEASISALEGSKRLVVNDLDASLTTIGPDGHGLLIAAANAYDQAKAALNILLAELHGEIIHIKAEHEKNGVVCPCCHGEGEVLRSRSCAEDDAPDPDDPSDYERCLRCDGLGYIPTGDA